MVESKHIFANSSPLNEFTQHSIAKNPLKEGGIVKHKFQAHTDSPYTRAKELRPTNLGTYCSEIDGDLEAREERKLHVNFWYTSTETFISQAVDQS